jgi:hypothetical protein
MPSHARRTMLYLDIDGVLLRRRATYAHLRDAFEVAPHALLFLDWATSEFDVKWLSARCQNGDVDEVCRAFRHALGRQELPVEWRIIETVPADHWTARKIDSVDLAADFFWLDDNPGVEAIAILVAHGRTDRLIEVSVERDPNDLRRAKKVLAARLEADRTSGSRNREL